MREIDVSTRFFGERWDAPRVDHAIQVTTPVGELCLHCDDPIEAGDRGLVMPVIVGLDDAGQPTADIRPAHIECDLRSTLSHICKQCHCFVQHPSMRAEARATLDAINAQRAAEGRDPL